MRRGGGESSLAVGFPQRSWRGAGSVVYAGDCLAGGAGCGKGEPGESGRGAGADQCRGGQFPAGRAVAATAVGSPAARGGVAAPSGLARVRAVDSAAGGGAQAGCHREAATVGGGDCAAAGTEAEAGGSGAAGGPGKHGQKIRERQPRVSATDPEARRMKMPNGGFNPAVNVQLATDTQSRAIVGVEVSQEGCDSTGLSEPMRQQVEQRTGGQIEQHLLDGGYLRKDDIEQAHRQGVELFVPPKAAKNPQNRGRELEPRRGDSEAVLEWKQRMASEAGKEIYKERAATSETVNADLRSYRGLSQITVRGLHKARCVALWCALAYNVMHFGSRLLN